MNQISRSIRITFILALILGWNAPKIAAQTITTLAGGIGDGQNAATYGRVFGPYGVATDGSGNVYFMDFGALTDYQYRLRKISPSGIITTFAGNSNQTTFGPSGLGGQAIDASIEDNSGVASDAAGNIYISYGNNVNKINTSGIMTLVAGATLGSGGFSGDGSAAVGAMLSHPVGMAIDGAGNIFIADNGNNRIRKVSTSGIITTVAGGGSVLGDGGPATSAMFNGPVGVAVDATGNLYITDAGNQRIRKVNAAGYISTIAGTGGCCGFSGAGGPATAAMINSPYDIKLDGAGNVYFSDYGVPYICKINAAGILSVLSGTGTGGFSGDGGAATAAKIKGPRGIALDPSGNLYFADGLNLRIREINTAGNINTIAGGNQLGDQGFAGDGASAYLAEFNTSSGVWTDPAGNVYVADGGNSRIRKISTTGVITTWAGGSISGFAGDGGPATAAELDNPYGGITDRFGNTYIADYGNNHVRKIDPSGIITTVAGGGSAGLGDGGPATAAEISAYGVGVDTSGNIYIADGSHNRIRKVTASSGIITTVAGTGVYGSTGSGGPATAAEIYSPTDVKVDNSGNIYIADNTFHMVSPAGIITTIPGAFGGALSIDKAGNVYLVEQYNGYKVNRYDIYGYLSVVAGNGQVGYAGEGVPASACEFSVTAGVAIDTAGNLYVNDMGATIRKVCCLSFVADHPPVYTHGSASTLTLCASSDAASLDTFLSVADLDTASTETWTVTTAPAHGTLTGFPASAISTGGTITPSGLSYTPTTGYTGLDYFRIRISDGEDTAIMMITVTISPLPATGTISGPGSLCPGDTATCTETVPGGIWTSSNMSVATIGTTGLITALSAGTDSIIYTESFSCGLANVVHPLTVNVVPSVIAGSGVVCTTSTDTLNDATAGGTWLSSNPAIASVGSASGVVSGIAAGSTEITYTLPGGCYAATSVIIDATPSAGSITGAGSLCAGATTALTDTTSSGTWTSSSALATVAGGLVTAVSAGTDTILYSVSNICGTNTAEKIITINPTPAVATIGGTTTLTAGSTTLLTDAAPGGSWTSSSTLVATIDTTGLVTGLTAGTTIITYTLTNTFGCNADTTLLITVTGPSGISNLNGAAGFSLFPNPAVNELTIAWKDSKSDNIQVIITDVTGREILKRMLQTPLASGQTSFGLDGIPDGVYAVAIRTDSGKYCTKLVVAK